ncbi:WSC-domain-containing protein [Lepidopterella palustris CBS 459.81]|uniref:WSC-domain-containing protein n=1 Tax=Lepidopterella palustris CBS 459.81 TaxID=1314670 RepID=A0A8E2E0M0_9PEZI|nr:WSC-domain-containing protein [Lepidopterella palustris CBS 459.81]
MKAIISSAVVAVALISSTTAIPTADQAPRNLQRRWDAPPLPPCSQNNYVPFTYVGCFVEPNPETLQYNPNLVFSTMTVETCTATCKSNGFRYAGLIYFGNCLCGTMLPPTQAPDSDCNAPCNGNPNEMCGSNQRFSIYQDPTYPAVDLSTIGSQYTPKGCYSEGVGYRAVTYRQDQLDFNTLTTEECLSACGHEYYPLAATEYYGECYCGYMLQGGSAPADSSNCNLPCNGNQLEICGGANYLDLYEATILESTQPCGTLPPPPPSTCNGTAYGYATSSNDVDKTFISLGIGNNWGWVIQGPIPVSGNLYLGAGGNDISKATIVGTFTIVEVGSNLVVTYTTNAPWYLSSTHFYYGTTFPSKIAPGKFGNVHTLSTPATTDSFTIPYDASKTTYIVHAGISSQC